MKTISAIFFGAILAVITVCATLVLADNLAEDYGLVESSGASGVTWPLTATGQLTMSGNAVDGARLVDATSLGVEGPAVVESTLSVAGAITSKNSIVNAAGPIKVGGSAACTFATSANNVCLQGGYVESIGTQTVMLNNSSYWERMYLGSFTVDLTSAIDVFGTGLGIALAGAADDYYFYFGDAAYTHYYTIRSYGRDRTYPTLEFHGGEDPNTEFRDDGEIGFNQANNYWTFDTGNGQEVHQRRALEARAIMTWTANATAGVEATVCDVTLTGGGNFAFGADLNTTLGNIVAAFNAASANCTAWKDRTTIGTKIVFLANTGKGVAGNSYAATETTDTQNRYSFDAATLTGARVATTITPQALTQTAFAGAIEVGGQVIFPRILAASPAEPVACASAYDGARVYVDDTDDTAYGQECICANKDGTAYDWRAVADVVGTACPFF